MIIISTKLKGAIGVAEAFAADRSFYAEGRSIANAIGNICSKMARVKELNGADWFDPSSKVGGKIGDSIKKPRRKSITEMDTFQLVGGMMHEPQAKQ